MHTLVTICNAHYTLKGFKIPNLVILESMLQFLVEFDLLIQNIKQKLNQALGKQEYWPIQVLVNFTA